jgi:hypothetical protein
MISIIFSVTAALSGPNRESLDLAIRDFLRAFLIGFF